MFELTIDILKQIIERIPEEYIVEIDTGKNVQQLLTKSK